MTDIIGPRFKALREAKRLSQDEVSAALGFRDRQTLSAIETGVRRVSADELLRAAEVFSVGLDTLTDPFLLIGEGRFSWRQKDVDPSHLQAYELDTGRFIAAYRTFAREVGPEPGLLRQELRSLAPRSRFEDASAAGERFAAAYDLGPVPAARLAATMEGRLDILVLMVDPVPGVSGAACRLPDLDLVLINRREVAGRRHFDLAHELFHILTWEAMPPEHVEEAAPKNNSRVEQLADSFASALLMPASALARFGDWSGLGAEALAERINAAADDLLVTSDALRWRLVGLGLVDKATATGIDAARLRHNGRLKAADEPLQPLFSRGFVEVVGRAMDEGRVSVRRTATLLGLTVDDLAELFDEHGLAAPFDL